MVDHLCADPSDMTHSPMAAGQLTGRAGQGTSEITSADFLVVSKTHDNHKRNPLPKSARLTHGGVDATIDIFGNPERVNSKFFPIENRAVYIIGRASHPTVARDQLPHWCSQSISSGNVNAVRELYGLFVVIIDDRRTREVTFVSDILGIRPCFVGKFKDQLVAGSNVLSICAAGLSSGQVNYDEVCAWLRYNQPCDTASVVNDYQALKPAVVATYRPDGLLIKTQTYGQLEFGSKQAQQDQVVEEAYVAAQKSVTTMTRGLDEINLPISGGYDSRLIFAIASQLPSTQLHVSTLATREYELELAKQIATAMNHPLTIVPGRTRILDLFDDPFCFTPGGFVTGRNLTNHIAARHPGMPLLSGFMGDGVMRGSLLTTGRAHFAKDAENLSLDDLTTAIDKRYVMHAHRLNLFNDGMRKRASERGMAALRKFVIEAKATGRPTVYSDLYLRNRLYYSNIVIQHLDVAEGMTPYCNFESLNARVRYDHTCFNELSYPNLFARYFPRLSGIAHNFTAENARHKQKKGSSPPTRHLRRWSADVAAGLLLTDILCGTKKRKIFSLLPAGLLGESLYQDEISFLYKLMTFERTLRKNGVRFDWNQI